MTITQQLLQPDNDKQIDATQPLQTTGDTCGHETNATQIAIGHVTENTANSNYHWHSTCINTASKQAEVTEPENHTRGTTSVKYCKCTSTQSNRETVQPMLQETQDVYMTYDQITWITCSIYVYPIQVSQLMPDTDR